MRAPSSKIAMAAWPAVFNSPLTALAPTPRPSASDVDYAQLVKVYGDYEGNSASGRYSPPACTGQKRRTIEGRPDPKHISTSFVERQNLTMRMQMRRFTRLTNAFSKKIEHHAYAVALHFMYYNFARIHKTLRVTPAMAAGVTDKLWDIADIVRVIEDHEARQVQEKSN